MTAMQGKSSSARRALILICSLLTVLLIGAVPCSAQTPGLVAAYNFNEGTGTTVADVSGNNLTGTVVGATWTTGRYGNGILFDGATNYVDLGNPVALQLSGSMTVEAWVYATANPSNDGQIVSKSSGPGWQLKTTPDTGVQTFGIKAYAASSSAQRYSTSQRLLNTWYHVAGVYDVTAGTLSMYVNGNLDNGTLVGLIPSSQLNQAVNVNIGRRTGGYYFKGIIDEVRIYNRALSQAEIQTDLATPIAASAPPPDTTPPMVSITGPLDGATLAGTTTLTAAASDNVGVAGVQFLLDGANLGNGIANPPYSMHWDTSTTTPGTHTLAAMATDFSNNSTRTANISVNVTAPLPAQVGQWSPVMTWPIVTVHAMLLTSGDVLGWTDYTTMGGAQIWRRASNTFVPKTYDTTSLFCAGHAYMADGRLMITGGIIGLTDDMGPHNATIFDPVTEQWSQGAMMNTGRYYPTATTLPDGRILVQGGTTTCVTCIADMPEIYDPVKDTWTQLAPSATMAFKYYPHSFVLPDGRIFVGSEDDKAIATQVLDLNTQTWSTIDSRVLDGHSTAMYLPGKIIKAGTATADNPGFPSAATTYIIDMTQPSPAWQTVAPMANPRSYLNLTILPDGQVLATGGSTTTDKANFAAAVFPAEMWSPATKQWTTMASMQTPRLYHSIGLLLPDATVLVSGGGRENGRSQPDPKDEANAEIFSPPYLFKGPRPVISSAPSLLQYGGSFSITSPDASRIATVSLIPLGAVTHAFNENQRYVPLTFTKGTGSLNAIAPANGNIAPPGPYMIFLVDSNGVPSVAAMTRLPGPNEDTQPPAAPTNLTATAATSSVSLAWTAANDNIAVTGYNIYRSTTPGFTPTAANKVGQTAITTYTDTGFTASGTYYYVVTAQDAAGNLSLPSNQAAATVSLDTTAPIISITSPGTGATVTGVVVLTASATDNVAVASVQFLLDGANLGAEVTGAGPTYTFNWNTSNVAGGTHVLSARARDGANNTALAANVTIVVLNTAPTGLIAAYSFNQGSGTTAVDGSGNGITGTLNGATWTTAGEYGNALAFNGASSFVDLGIPPLLQNTGSMTWAAWVFATATPANDGQIISQSASGGGWQLKTTPDTGPQTFGVKVTGSTGQAYRYSKTVRALNTWYHVAGVYNATTKSLDIYVNGVLDDGTLLGTVPAAQVLQNTNVNIGRRNGGYYFSGVIDEVRVYNRALSASEIQTIMTTPLP
jgi:hypothetical protein